MKQEDKAKLYDEALKKAKDVIEQNPLMEYLKKGIEYILPELKESEDEKVRKHIISVLEDCWQTCKNIDYDSSMIQEDIAWLKKQGEQKQDPCEHCDDKRLNCHNFPCIKKRAFKQGKSVLEVINEEKVDNANKVKHKFNEGDWVVNRENKIGQIKALKKDKYNVLRYCIEWKDGKKTNPIQYYTDNYCHLWTLSDVKNGDILYSPSLHLIWIYKNNKEVHAGINMNYLSSLSIGSAFVIPNDACPATKEQREQLKKAMTDAGYAFNFDKKELKKIEVEPAWSYEDEANLNNIIWLCNNCIKGSETTWIPSQATKIKHLIETIKEKGLVQQNPAWSEEDKKTLERVIRCIENHDYMNVDDIHWLKSLKQRYAWKPSDEQMDALLYISRYYAPTETDKLGWESLQTLELMLSQLKKLKGE